MSLRGGRLRRPTKQSFLTTGLPRPFHGLAMTINEAGFSVLEVILAAAIFVTFATAAVVVVISGIDNNRLGGEMTVANQFNTEGMEAVRSIKNQAFSNVSGLASGYCTTGTGVDISGGVWAFAGTSDILPSDSRFSRVIKICDVQRNVTGDIVASGGTNDPNTKKVTVATNWNFTSARPESVEFTDYLTNWESEIPVGLVVYADGSTIPKYRNYYASGSFDSLPFSTIGGSSGRFFSMRVSPTKKEAIVGYLNTSGNLQIMCFNGSSWTNEWSVSVGGTGTTRRFDIAYETNTGDVMVVYSRGVAGANALAYITKPGSVTCSGNQNDWITAVNFATSSSATTGTVQWVKAARDARSSSNNLSVIWADSNSDLGVNNWSGTAWATNTVTYKALETNLERVAASQDVESFDLVYESLSGNAMVVWGIATGANGTNGARYSRCTGGVYTCSWTAAATVPTVSDDIHNIDMSADPNTNRVVYAALGDAGDDLTAAYWSGSAWTGYANLDTSSESPFAGSKLVSTAWLINGSTTKWILNYDDATGTGLGWYAATPGSAPVKQTDFSTTPAINDIRERYDVDMGSFNQEQAVVTLTDSTRSIFAKRASMNAAGAITWTNADGGVSLGTTSAVPPQGFTFMYWRNQ